MEQEKNNKGIIILLAVLVAILTILCVLFATGTISFKSNESINNNQSSKNNISNDSNQSDENNSIVDNAVTDNIDNQTTGTTSSDENLQSWLGEYKGTDPWDDNLTIKINSINNDTINLIIETYLITSNDSYKKEVTTELINNTASFNIQGFAESKVNEFNYSLSLTLIDNGIRIKYISGYLSTIGPNGQRASSRHVGALTSDSNMLVLQKKS